MPARAYAQQTFDPGPGLDREKKAGLGSGPFEQLP